MLFQNFAHTIKHKIVTLRFSILSVFVTLFLLAMLSLLIVTYYNFDKSTSLTARKLMQQTSTSIFQNVTGEFQRIKIENQLAVELIQRKVIDPNNIQQMSNFAYSMLITEMQTLSSVHSIFWSSAQGMVVVAGKENDNSITTQLIDRTKMPALQTIFNRDVQGNIIKTSQKINPDYDARLRPWYLQTLKAKQTTVTDLFQYKYFGPHYWGITVATPVNDVKGNYLGIFSINVSLNFLRKMIETIKVSDQGVIFIVAENGKLIAFPHLVQYLNPTISDIHAISNPIVSESFDLYMQHRQPEFEFKVNGENYLATYKPMPMVGNPNTWLIAIVVPDEDFVGALKHTIILILLIGLAIIALGILLVSRLVTVLVRPMKKLVKETEKIKNFNLAGDVVIQSRIKEVIQLGDSLHDMKKGLRLFQKYVPSALVRQLIEAGEDAKVGGTKKQLVALFSDIESFTTIAESTEPNKLMIQIVEYLDALSKIITQEKGTIDKYIGDSIMAFWGAPLPEDQPAYHAAKTALLCQKRLLELNNNWIANGIKPFITRIGIHKGDAIVGNVGSTERLNYTAIGDAVNTASRLEGVNKAYFTKIIVSNPVYEDIKHQFVLRPLDSVFLKGKHEAMTIYELVAENKSELNFDIDAYMAIFAQAFAEYKQQHWERAILYFKQCLEIYAEDTVAPVFIQRCEYLRTNPPGADWQGVWQVKEK